MRLLSAILVLTSACSFIDDYDGFVVGDGGVETDATPIADVGVDAADAALVDVGPMDAGCSDATCGAGRYCREGVCADDGIIALRAAGDQACVVLQSGRARCWGSNFNGQLGRLEGHITDDPEDRDGAAPGYMELDATIVDVTMSASHSCALTDDGELYCMGASEDYLGIGEGLPTNGVTTPTIVDFGVTADVTLVSAGNSATCATTGVPDSRLYCWGSNDRGLIGQTSSTNSRDTPRATFQQPGVGTVATLAMGYDSACVLGADKSLECWGDNDSGQLGLATPTDSHLPLPVGEGYVSIDVGRWAACAVTDTAELDCWGWNYYGQVATGASSEEPEPITRVELLDAEAGDAQAATVLSVSMGDEFVCAIGRNERGTDVYCWGRNDEGQCGADIATATVFYTPKKVRGAENAIAIAAGDQHVCALFDTAPTVRCWGQNNRFSLGTEFGDDWTHVPQALNLYPSTL